MNTPEVSWMVEWIADLLKKHTPIEIDNAKKQDLRNIIAGLPKGASLSDLVNAIKDYETKQNAINRIGFVIEIIVNQPIDITSEEEKKEYLDKYVGKSQ